MRIALLFCLAFWLLVLTVVKAWAVPDYLQPIPPIKLNAVGIIGANGLNESMQRRLMRGAKAYLRNYGIRIIINKYYKAADPYPYYREECNDLNCIEQEFSAYWHKFGYLRRSNELLHIIAPPIKVDGHLYFGGVASTCSIKQGGFSYSNAEQFNSLGQARYRHSLNAMIHEILHALGAQHDQSNANVMHQAASQFVAGRVLPLNQKAISEILRCSR